MYMNIGIKHDFSRINVHQVRREMLKDEGESGGLHLLPRNLAIVDALKNNVWSLLMHKFTWIYDKYGILFCSQKVVES